jgi:hypothetical protein
MKVPRSAQIPVPLGKITNTALHNLSCWCSLNTNPIKSLEVVVHNLAYEKKMLYTPELKEVHVKTVLTGTVILKILYFRAEFRKDHGPLITFHVSTLLKGQSLLVVLK